MLAASMLHRRDFDVGSIAVLALIPGVFLVSIPLAFLSPPLAECLWVASFFLHPSRRSARKRNQYPR